MKKLFLVVIAAVTILIFNSTSQACSCSRSKPNPCESYGVASAVFIGLATKESESGKIQIKVEETFAGNLESVVDAIYSPIFCGFNFKEGKRYLIYTRAKPKDGENLKFFISSRCTRTRLLEEASEDLEFLRNQRQEMTGSRIYGKVVKDYSTNFNLPPAERHPPISGVNVKITGQSQEYNILTNASGLFEINNLAAGEYSVEVPFPKDYLIFGDVKRTTFINHNGCAATTFYIQK